MALLFALGLMLPSLSASAQDDDDMNFSMDETDGGGDANAGGEGGDDEFNFSVDETAKGPTKKGEGPPVTGIVIVGDGETDPSLAAQFTDVLMVNLDRLEEYTSRPNNGLVDKFAVLGAQDGLECAYDPICLSRIGEELGVEYLLIGRLTGTKGSYGINLDLIDVKGSTVKEYVTRSVDGGASDVEKAIADSFPRLFNIRKGAKKKGAEPDREVGPVQKGVAWGTLGLGVVFVGAGVYFGLDASSIEDELTNGARKPDAPRPYILTQKEAQARLDDAESSALLANVFYGLSIAAGATSALLFLIKPGSDIATEEELSDGFHLSPLIGPDGAGVSAEVAW